MIILYVAVLKQRLISSGHRVEFGEMGLSAVYLQHRVQLLGHHVSALVQTMKMRHPDDADDLADLERIWQAEVEEMHAAVLRRDRSYFDQRERSVSKRRGV